MNEKTYPLYDHLRSLMGKLAKALDQFQRAGVGGAPSSPRV